MKHQFIARIAGIVSVCTVGVFSASAEGIGPLGHPNLFANPDFESASIASDSNSGLWGWFNDGKVSLNGWTGGGNAGVASKDDATTWLPKLPANDNYRAFIQMASGYANGYSWIEQTVTPDTSGIHAFTCQYSTRHMSDGRFGNGGTLGFSIARDGTAKEFANVSFPQGYFEYQSVTFYLNLEAGQPYTFRLYGKAGPTTDRTAMIASCALEHLGQTDLAVTTISPQTKTGLRQMSISRRARLSILMATTSRSTAPCKWIRTTRRQSSPT